MTPRDDDPWRRLREREEEEEKEKETTAAQRPAASKAGLERPPTAASNTETLERLMEQVPLLIEQLNQLYNQYFAGIEKLPPLQKRKQLDQMMVTLQMSPKPTTAIQFKCQNIQSSYMTAKDRWDRMLKDLESGKIKRRQ